MFKSLPLALNLNSYTNLSTMSVVGGHWSWAEASRVLMTARPSPPAPGPALSEGALWTWWNRLSFHLKAEQISPAREGICSVTLSSQRSQGCRYRSSSVTSHFSFHHQTKWRAGVAGCHCIFTGFPRSFPAWCYLIFLTWVPRWPGGLANGERAGQERSTFKCGSFPSLVFLVFRLVFP